MFPAAAALLWAQLGMAGWLEGGAAPVLSFGGAAETAAKTRKEEMPGEEKPEGEMPQLIVITRGGKTLYRSAEEYLPGVVACQLPEGNWSEAVWQCQAVLARTCLMSLMKGRQRVREEELELETADSDAEGLRGQQLADRLIYAEQAVRATAGRTLVCKGETVCPLFHRASAGRTRDGGENFPYLRSVPCAADARREEFLSSVSFTWQELADRLRQAGGENQTDASELPGTVQIVKRDGAGYVERLQLCGRSYTGDEIRFLLGLASPAFSVAERKDGLTFQVRGSGHGYGLSQAYAQTLAEGGASCEDILHYFYQDVVIAEE